MAPYVTSWTTCDLCPSRDDVTGVDGELAERLGGLVEFLCAHCRADLGNED